MAVSTVQQAAQEIKQHMDKEGSGYRNWYVGITSDGRERLFNEHGVSEKNGCWIFRTLETADEARKIEQHFIEKLGTDGGTGGGDNKSRVVYAYKKTSQTNP